VPGVPLYRALADVLRHALAEGLWPPGALLPTEADLGARFGVSRITVRHALQLLQAEGHIRTRRARRTEVLAHDPLARGRTTDTLAELVRAAGDIALRVRSFRRETHPDIAGILGVPPTEPLPCLRGQLLRGGVRWGRTAIRFRPEVGDRLARDDFDDPIVFRVLQRKLGLRFTDVRMTVWADIADAEDVAVIGCTRGEAMLCTRLVYFVVPDRAVEVTDSRFPAKMHSVSFSIDVDGA
jgi:GntR family transcriptional regulator